MIVDAESDTSTFNELEWAWNKKLQKQSAFQKMNNKLTTR